MAHPNIIIIMADQLRWDCLGYAGNPDVRTPNLDAMATHGLSFSQAICQQPLCAPSRVTTLTGLYPAEHGVRDNCTPLHADIPTLPRLFGDAGYRTAAVGKLHQTPPRTDIGFDVMRLAEQEGPGRDVDDYHAWLVERGRVDRLDYWDQVNRAAAPPAYWSTFGAMKSNLPEACHSTTWIGDQAVRFVSEAGSRPFLLWVGFVKPHHPFDPPSPWHRLYDAEALRLPPGFALPVPDEDAARGGFFDPREMTEAKFRNVLAHYYANISHMDRQIGRILATLTARGCTNNILVFCADHGDYMGQHGLILKGPQRPYDALLRVPLLVAGVPRQRRGARDEAPAELTDLFPTLCELADLPCPSNCSGRSLAPRLLDAGAALRDTARAENTPDVRILRSPECKLVESADPYLRAFYDLRRDPHETTNLYDSPRQAAAVNLWRARMAEEFQGSA